MIVCTTGLGIAAFGASSALAASGVTIKTSYEDSPVSLLTADAVGYAITNTTGVSQTVSFTDTLPGGVTLNDPIGLTITPGSGLSSSVCTDVSSTESSTQNPSQPPSQPGDSTVVITATVAPEASGTVCTISLQIVAATPSASDQALSDSYSDVTATPASGPVVTPATTVGSLIVLTNPTLSITAPVANQSFHLGQVFDAQFSCQATDPLDAIDDFFGTDDEGNDVEAGAPIDTVDPGQHTLEVDCYSAVGGGDLAQTVNYTVGSYTLTAVKAAKKTDDVSYSTVVPAGQIVSKLTYDKKVIGRTTTAVAAKTPGADTKATVTIKPTAAAVKQLDKVKGSTARATLQVSFTPAPVGTGDNEITPQGPIVITKTVTLPVTHPVAKKSPKKKTA